MSARTFVLLQAIIELVGGLVFVLAPAAILSLLGIEIDSLHIILLRTYGVAALTLAFYGLQVYRIHQVGAMIGFYKVIMFFQMGISVSMLIGYLTGLPALLGALVLHALLCIGCVFYYIDIQRRLTKA